MTPFADPDPGHDPRRSRSETIYGPHTMASIHLYLTLCSPVSTHLRTQGPVNQHPSPLQTPDLTPSDGSCHL